MKIYKGFTLTELLIVVAILVMLMLLSFLAVRHQIAKGYDARRKTDVYQIKVAVEEYEKDHNCYPETVSCDDVHREDFKNYIPYIPCDPEFHTSYVYYADPNSSCPRWYQVFTKLSNQNDPKIEELNCENGCGFTPQIADSRIFNYYEANPNSPDVFKGTPSLPEGGSTPAPSSGTSIVNSGLYGCKTGVCTEIPIVNGVPECSPTYSKANCYNKCTDDQGDPNPLFECM